MEFFWYWLLNDGLGNKKKHRGFWDNGGHDEKNDSGLDKFLARQSDTVEKIIKIGGVIISSVLYILLVTSIIKL
jgi:hypothetical protein